MVSELFAQATNTLIGVQMLIHQWPRGTYYYNSVFRKKQMILADVYLKLASTLKTFTQI